MKIIKGIEEIRAAKTVDFPRHDDVCINLPDYVKGWVTAQHDQFGKWHYTWHETREDAIAFYESEKRLFNKLSEIDPNIDWAKRSEMYVYHSSGEFKPCWAIAFSVFEQ